MMKLTAEEIKIELENADKLMDAVSNRLSELEAEQNVFCPEFEELLEDSRIIEKSRIKLKAQLKKIENERK